MFNTKYYLPLNIINAAAFAAAFIMSSFSQALGSETSMALPILFQPFGASALSFPKLLKAPAEISFQKPFAFYILVPSRPIALFSSSPSNTVDVLAHTPSFLPQ